MDDLISRQAAIDALVKAIREDPYYDSNASLNGLGVCDVRVIINDLPSAEPEIIRCKNCKYYEWMSNRVPDEQTWFCHNWNAETGKDDFCSYAEKET